MRWCLGQVSNHIIIAIYGCNMHINISLYIRSSAHLTKVVSGTLASHSAKRVFISQDSHWWVGWLAARRRPMLMPTDMLDLLAGTYVCANLWL